MRLRLVFMGTAELGIPSFHRLAELHDIAAVVTQPDRPVGRQLRPQPPLPKLAALKHSIPVLQPERARDPAFIDQVRALHPDLIVVIAYGQILPAELLRIPRHGCINLHTSLLPKYRGAAPIQWALLNEETETGVTVMRMDEGLDTGPILAQARTLITPADTSETLHHRLAQMGADLLADSLPLHAAGTLIARPQPAEGASYARKIRREDGRADWTLPARTLHTRLRAFTPWPGLHTALAGGVRLKIWSAEPVPCPGDRVPGRIREAGAGGIVVECGTDGLRLQALQREGGRRMGAGEFLSGHPLPPGTLLA